MIWKLINLSLLLDVVL